MSNDVDLYTLADAIKKATAAADRLLKCAESISNPVYSVVMQGRTSELKILAVRHFAGQIVLTVEDPLSAFEQRQREQLNAPNPRIGRDVIDV